MNNNERTKDLFANALLELTNVKPLSDISISDITTFCDISRNTFYYHFKDKQELIYWIYAKFHNVKINLSFNSQYSNTVELLNFMRNYSTFFKQAFSETGQNCFRNELYESICKDYVYIINSLYDATGIDTDTTDFMARFFAHTLVDMAELFLNSESEDTDKLVRVFTLIQSKGLEGTLESLRAENTAIESYEV